jgi:hypothetical protein
MGDEMMDEKYDGRLRAKDAALKWVGRGSNLE